MSSVRTGDCIMFTFVFLTLSRMSDTYVGAHIYHNGMDAAERSCRIYLYKVLHVVKVRAEIRFHVPWSQVQYIFTSHFHIHYFIWFSHLLWGLRTNGNTEVQWGYIKWTEAGLDLGARGPGLLYNCIFTYASFTHLFGYTNGRFFFRCVIYLVCLLSKKYVKWG